MLRFHFCWTSVFEYKEDVYLHLPSSCIKHSFELAAKLWSCVVYLSGIRGSCSSPHCSVLCILWLSYVTINFCFLFPSAHNYKRHGSTEQHHHSEHVRLRCDRGPHQHGRSAYRQLTTRRVRPSDSTQPSLLQSLWGLRKHQHGHFTAWIATRSSERPWNWCKVHETSATTASTPTSMFARYLWCRFFSAIFLYS